MERVDRIARRLLLRLYPAEFRARHGAELDAIYEHCLSVERARRGAMLARLMALIDATRGAVALRRQARPGRTGSLTSTVVQDLRFAVRGFRRAPVFFAGMMLVLALGIGANGAIFSLVKAALLDPLPYQDPEKLVVLWNARPDSPERRSYGASLQMLSGMREHASDVLETAGMALWSLNKTDMDLVLDDRAERVRGAFVTPNFFQVLGIEADRGRVFSEADGDASPMLAVISHRFWTREFGQDPSVIGRRLTLFGRLSIPLDREAHVMTVIGVLPPAVHFTYPDQTEFWVLQSWSDVSRLTPGGTNWFAVLTGRVRPGVTLGHAEARVAALSDEIFASSAPERRPRLGLQPVSDWVAGETRPAVLLVTGVSLLLLVIACATVAGALLVRLAERQRELAIRASLGAGRSRLFRQLVLEGVALSAIGSAAGSLLAILALPAFRALVPSAIPRGDEIGVDAWIIVFAAGTAAAVTILATLVPALLAARPDVVSSFRRLTPSASASGSVLRWRSGLVTAQTAITTCLVIGSTLLLTSYWQLHRVELGFDADDVVTVEMRLLDGRSEEALARFQDELLNRVRAIPGVVQAGLTTAVPFRGVDFVHSYDAPGCEGRPREQTAECRERSVGANRRSVDSSYFDILDIRPTRGRLLLPSDTATAPKVAVVSESFARRMFPDQNPIGQTFSQYDPMLVVGVVPDLRYVSRDEEARPAVYVARGQLPSELMCLVVRAAPGVTGIGDALRRAVHDVDPAVPAMNLTTVDQIISDSVADRRFYTTTTSAFAALALLLTATGLVVVIARTVVERRREIAIRAALGARAGQLIGPVVRQGMVPVLMGTAVGLFGAWFGTSLLQAFLFNVSAHEPLVYAGAGLLTALVAGLACVVPASRLTHMKPATVLRSE